MSEARATGTPEPFLASCWIWAPCSTPGGVPPCTAPLIRCHHHIMSRSGLSTHWGAQDPSRTPRINKAAQQNGGQWTGVPHLSGAVSLYVQGQQSSVSCVAVCSTLVSSVLRSLNQQVRQTSAGENTHPAGQQQALTISYGA